MGLSSLSTRLTKSAERKTTPATLGGRTIDLEGSSSSSRPYPGRSPPRIYQLMNQLLSAGCEPEASMLHFLHLGVPPSLTTCSAALAALGSK
uniref:Uncharacterized protein n=1 Tax=Timema shepardi TaxID=629360 RepID=A0A7R9AXG1_TIMSH|nr:unnamed protein product [Timema shepardi]